MPTSLKSLRMNAWTIMAPYAHVGFSSRDLAALTAFEADLDLIPGVKRVKNSPLWAIPENALEVVAALRERHQVDLTQADWQMEPPTIPEWHEVEAILRAKGEVRPAYLAGFATPYQEKAIATGWRRKGIHYWIPTGAGKSFVSLLTGLSAPGAMVIVTRSSSRLQFAREVERFLDLRALVLKPASLMRKKDLSLDQYLARCKETRKRPVILVGWDSIGDQLDQLMSLYIGSLILDESHSGKGQKRWDVVHLPELPDDPTEAEQQVKAWEKEARGKAGFLKQDKETGRYKMLLPVINRASAAARLARHANKKIGLSATPVKDRVRDLWAQLDLGEPNAWGNATKWLDRYANRHEGKYGGFDTRGSSNLDELILRIKHCAHILTYEETHSHLPPKRRQSFYVSPEDQVMDSGFKKLLKDARKRGPLGVLEAQLMQAAARKRKAVLTLIEDHLTSGHKVVLFTGRRKDCEKLGEDVAKMPIVKNKDIKVWVAHGGNSLEERDEIVSEYMAYTGPCVLVGTGQAWGESLNLDSADAAIFVMLPLTPGQLRQWEGRFCIVQDEIVLTRNGVKPIQDIQKGDWVLTHKGRWQPVLGTHSRNLKTWGTPTECSITEINVSGTPNFRVTANHSLLVSVNEQEPDWMDAGRVTVGDELVTPRLKFTSGNQLQLQFPKEFRLHSRCRNSKRYPTMPEWVDVDADFAWLLGLVVGDGWTSSSTSHYVGIAGDSWKMSDLHRAQKAFAQLGVNAVIRAASKGRGSNLHAYSKELARWFRQMVGASSQEKRVPPMVFTWPQSLVESFVEGYLRADGHLRPGVKSYDWTTVSPHLAFGMLTLLCGLGYPATTHKTSQGVFQGTINPNSRMRIDDNYIYRRVRETFTHYAKGEERELSVFDLTVRDDESFMVQGITVHNSRLSSKKPVIIYYAIAEGTVDEHWATVLIDKLPAVEKIIGDVELASAEGPLSGWDPDISDDDFAASILSNLDYGDDEDEDN